MKVHQSAFLMLYLCGFWLMIGGCEDHGRIGRARQLHPLAITSAVPPQAVLKEAYGGIGGFSVTATGGVAPYSWTWAAASGSTLPPGLQLASHQDGTGTIGRTPTHAGPYGVIVTVADSESLRFRKV